MAENNNNPNEGDLTAGSDKVVSIASRILRKTEQMTLDEKDCVREHLKKYQTLEARQDMARVLCDINENTRVRARAAIILGENFDDIVQQALESIVQNLKESPSVKMYMFERLKEKMKWPDFVALVQHWALYEEYDVSDDFREAVRKKYNIRQDHSNLDSMKTSI